MDPLWSKAIVVVLIVLVLSSLGSALYYLVHDQDESTRRLKALRWRVTFSALLVLYLILAFYKGWLHPHGILG